MKRLPSDPLKQETLVWIFSITCSLLLYSVVALLIQQVYSPDIAAIKAAGDELLIGVDNIRPEPVETMLFRAAIIIIPLCLAVFYSCFSKAGFIKKLAAKQFFHLITALCIAVIGILAYLGFSAANPFYKDGEDKPQIWRDHVAATNFDFYFDGFLPGGNIWLYSACLFPLVCCLFFMGIQKYRWDEQKAFKVGSSIATNVLVGCIVVVCMVMSVFYFPYQSENMFNFNAVYYSMTQVYAGVPLLTGHFLNTYGLYPHFLNPLFQLIGLNVYNFSFVMAFLIGLSFIINFYCLKQFVKNNVILCFGMLTVIFFPFLDFKFCDHFDANFAMYPVRYLVPSILVFLSVMYFNKRKHWQYWTITVVMASLVLWNPEIGIVCYISWLAFNTYIDYYNNTGKPAYKKISLHWIYGIGTLVSVFYTYKFMVYLFYGQMPDMGLLWSSVFVFGKLSFNMLPMALVHPWNMVALVLILGLLYAISKWHKKVVTAKAALVFLLSVTGIGFFIYFQGRSHNWQLAQSSGMSLMLLTILGDELWEKARDSKILALQALFSLFLYVISFSFFLLLFNPGKLYELMTLEEAKQGSSGDQYAIEHGREYMIHTSDEHQKVYVLTLRKFQGLFFDGTKRVSAFNPGMVDLVFKDDVRRLEKQLLDSPFNVYITQQTFHGLQFMERPLAAIAATYQLQAKNDFMAMLSKRRPMIPKKTFFTNRSSALHRKYHDDLASAQLRVDDAFGVKRLDLKDTFSIEMLFDSEKQIFPAATLLGNQDDSVSGFAISKILNSEKYAFVFNDKGFTLTMPQNGWVYCVVNVFPGHFEVYFNGNRVRSHPLAKPVKPSAKKICIGNLGYIHNYIGAIGEVAINNHAVDTMQISETWGQIRTEFRAR